MKRRVWQTVSRILSLSLIFAMALSLVNPIAVQAKTKTLKLPFAEIGQPYESYMESVAVTVNKTGNYKVVQKKHSYYFGGVVKFVAPKTKKYTFTFSEFRAKKNSPILAYIEFSEPSGIENGINYLLPYSKGYSGGQFPVGYKVKGKKNVQKRDISMSMQEGQVVYIHIVNAYTNTKGKKMTSKFKIK